MDQETFERETANKTEERDVNIRTVNGGYVMQGIRRFMSNDTGLLAFSFTLEAVGTKDSVSGLVASFLTNGKFG